MRLLWIGLRPSRGEPVVVPNQAQLLVGKGVMGDRFRPSKDSKREVTLMLTHQVEAISREVGHAIPYAVFRRNLVFESSLETLEFQRCYRLGSALLEITGPCPPCARMKEKLGEVGFRAMRGRGGYTARVIEEGSIQLGEVLTPIDVGPLL